MEGKEKERNSSVTDRKDGTKKGERQMLTAVARDERVK